MHNNFKWLNTSMHVFLQSVLLCEILRPRELTSEKLMNISSIKEVKIVVTYLSRWVPEVQRDEAW